MSDILAQPPVAWATWNYPDTFLPEEIHQAAKPTCAWIAQRAQGGPLVGVDACRFLLVAGLLLRDMKVVAMNAEERATQMPGILVPQYVVDSAFPLDLMKQVIHKALLQARLLATPNPLPRLLEDDKLPALPTLVENQMQYSDTVPTGSAQAAPNQTDGTHINGMFRHYLLLYIANSDSSAGF